jgi:alginate O-acetyltransferase complex protein AlgJ
VWGMGQQAESPALPPVHESWLPKEHSLYRPRHGTQTFSLISAMIFFLVPVLALAVLGPSETTENRRRADFPSVTGGWQFFGGLSPWANDHLAFKAGAINVVDFVSREIFGERPDLGRDTQRPVGPVAPPPPPPTTTRTGPPDSKDRDTKATSGYQSVVEGRDDWLYLGFDIQGKCEPSQTQDEMLARLRALRTAVEQSGRKFVLVIAPDKTTVEPFYLPKDYTGKACAAQASDKFWKSMTVEPGVVDLRGAIREESNRLNRPLYFPQDTHWTFEGALLMTRILADHLKPGTSDPWKVLPGPEWKGAADLPNLIGSSGENRTTQPGLAIEGDDNRANWINGDFRTTLTFQRHLTPGMVGGKVAMLADSYTRFATGYLAAAFGDISITHVEQLTKDSQAVADRLAAADTVVIEVVERHLAAGVSPVTNPLFVERMAATVTARPRG